MAKFSILNPLLRGKSAPNTVNFEGGRAFTQTAKLELVSVLLTTFLTPIALASAWHAIEERTKEFVITLLILEQGSQQPARPPRTPRSLVRQRHPHQASRIRPPRGLCPRTHRPRPALSHRAPLPALSASVVAAGRRRAHARPPERACGAAESVAHCEVPCARPCEGRTMTPHDALRLFTKTL